MRGTQRNKENVMTLYENDIKDERKTTWEKQERTVIVDGH